MFKMNFITTHIYTCVAKHTAYHCSRWHAMWSPYFKCLIDNFILIHPVIYSYTRNKRITKSNTTLRCHITQCYMFQFTRTSIRHLLLQKI